LHPWRWGAFIPICFQAKPNFVAEPLRFRHGAESRSAAHQLILKAIGNYLTDRVNAPVQQERVLGFDQATGTPDAAPYKNGGLAASLGPLKRLSFPLHGAAVAPHYVSPLVPNINVSRSFSA